MTGFLPLRLGTLGLSAPPDPPAPSTVGRREGTPDPDREGPRPGSEQLVAVVRSLCARLSALERQEAAGDDLTAAQRTLLADLARRGPATLPQLARAKSVTRQQVRVVVEALTRRGLVRRLSNPAHRRSFLVGVTAEGARKARRIARGGLRRLRKIERALGTEGVRGVNLALRAVLDAFDESGEA